MIPLFGIVLHDGVPYTTYYYMMGLVKEKIFIYNKIPKLDVVGSIPIARMAAL